MAMGLFLPTLCEEPVSHMQTSNTVSTTCASSFFPSKFDGAAQHLSGHTKPLYPSSRILNLSSLQSKPINEPAHLQPPPSESQQGVDREQSGSDDDDFVDAGAKGTFRERMDEHQKTLRNFATSWNTVQRSSGACDP